MQSLSTRHPVRALSSTSLVTRAKDMPFSSLYHSSISSPSASIRMALSSKECPCNGLLFALYYCTVGTALPLDQPWWNWRRYSILYRERLVAFARNCAAR